MSPKSVASGRDVNSTSVPCHVYLPKTSSLHFIRVSTFDKPHHTYLPSLVNDSFLSYALFNHTIMVLLILTHSIIPLLMWLITFFATIIKTPQSAAQGTKTALWLLASAKDDSQVQWRIQDSSRGVLIVACAKFRPCPLNTRKFEVRLTWMLEQKRTAKLESLKIFEYSELSVSFVATFLAVLDRNLWFE